MTVHMELVIVVIIAVAAAVLVTALLARRTPEGSGGAPGEVVADQPLSSTTGASVEDTSHAGLAEDRPGGPDLELDPDGPELPPSEDQTQGR